MLNRLISLLMLFATSASFSQEQKSILLYPGGVPGSKKTPGYQEKRDPANPVMISKVTDPTITPYLPEAGKANGTAVIICPGGGYAFLASKHEGSDVAIAFTKMGITAFVLKYRLPSDSIMRDKSAGPLQDAQRAIQLVRERAAEWSINPAKIGIMGFSAGGHLASTAGTHFNKAVIDNKENINLRPDFMLLIYPVVNLGEFAHPGSKENLLGKNPPQALVDLYSNERQVTADTPPTFIVHAEDDHVVPVQNALFLYDALLKNKVKAEMHIYEAGGHGFGMENPTTTDRWFERCAEWLKANGFNTIQEFLR